MSLGAGAPRSGDAAGRDCRQPPTVATLGPRQSNGGGRDPVAHRRAVVLMIVAPTLWSIAGVVTRHLDSAGRWEVTFWRSLFAAVFVLAALLFTRGASAWDAVRATGGYGVLSGAMWAIMFVAFMLALMTTTTANKIPTTTKL